MRRPRKNAWCSKHEVITTELALFGLRKVMTLAVSALAQLLGLPWERVKKRRQRGWSWTEALELVARPARAFNNPQALY